MEQAYEQYLDDVSYQVAVPEQAWNVVCYDPKHRNDRQREGQRDEERHLVAVV